VVVGAISLSVVGTRDSAPLPRAIVRIRANHGVVLHVVVKLVSVFDVNSSAAHVVQRVLRNGGQVRVVYYDAALVAVLDRVTVSKAVGTVAHGVEVDAVAADHAALPALLHARVLWMR